MPMKNWMMLRFRQDGGDDPDAAAEPQMIEVTNLDGLPVQILAGVNSIGKLAANSGVDIGDVDVTSLPATPAGAALIGKVGFDSSIGTWKSMATAGAYADVQAVGTFMDDGGSPAPIKGNQSATLLASAARTATISSADQTNKDWRGGRVYLDVTTASGTGGLTLTVEVKDPASGKYVTVLTSVSFTTTGLRAFAVYPGIGAVANQSASDVIGRTWRVTVTAGDGSSYTYSVGADVVK